MGWKLGILGIDKGRESQSDKVYLLDILGAEPLDDL